MSVTYQLDKRIQSQWQKETRLYTITLCQNLWGVWIVTKTWGSAINRGFGKSRDLFCSDYQSGIELYYKLQQRREKRGYTRVG
ncbi:MAG: hypothetical protein HC820_00045 [Hydrococcus sp. RM1_1_31]|nr:hypothetical protein [Hydrococcus sp. RM1_1_31]